MDDSDDAQARTVAACVQCGSIYAAIELDGGGLQPIGSRDGCSCGSTSFTDLDDTAAAIDFADGDATDDRSRS
ncbi:hypothetical protein ACFO5R_08860 [Halosolutus amylolyticus]|uniref:Uncharacterized protein n=1 Tax=Halosolutus amylolyticus TaxID=2932267 RepID=A0ABD5PND3_9EURY|nr:hypothetical protein [Halosolutus amylolyticus]